MAKYRKNTQEEVNETVATEEEVIVQPVIEEPETTSTDTVKPKKEVKHVLTLTKEPIRSAPTLFRKDVISESDENATYLVVDIINNTFGTFYNLNAGRYIFKTNDTVEIH